MMRNKKWLGIGLATTMLASVALVGCGDEKTTSDKQGDSGKMDAEQVLNLPFTAEIPSLDISKTSDDVAFTVLGQINEGLTRLDKDGKAVGAVAEKWDISQDGLTYTFHLRDTKWANGEPVTAKDFEYSWMRSLNPDTASPYAFMVGWIKGGSAYNAGKGPKDAVGIKAIDDKTLEVKLDHPVPFFAEQMAFPIFFPQNQKFVESKGDKYAAEAENLLANGPFKMTKWKHEESSTLEKNDQYYDAAKVKLKTINFLIVKDSAAAVNLYEAGQLDRTTGLVREQVDTYKNSAEFGTEPELTSGYVMYNQRVKALTNAKVRQALTWAIDADAYVDIVYHNGTKPGTGLVPFGISNGQGGEFRTDNGDLVGRKDNAAKAKAALKEGLTELGLTEFPVINLVADDGDVGRKSSEFVQEQWRTNLGIKVNVEAVPFKLRLQRARAHDFDLLMAVWGADYNDPMTYLDLFMSDSSFNYGNWKNDQYDALVKKAQVESDKKKRIDYMKDAEKLLMKEMPIGPTFFRGQAYLTKSYVKNIQPSVFGPDYDLKETYIQGKK
jgi:oligopeptide transport system substrate-binding protein